MASTSDEQPTKKILLKSSDGEEFSVDVVIALQSQTIKHMIEDDCADQVIPLPNVTGNILSKVIEYCKKHVEATTDEEKDKVKQWDTDEFIKADQKLLFDIILAANYLDVKSLLVLSCQSVADMIKGYSPEDVRKLFNIVNDFTEEEEAALRAENAWAFENPNTST